GFQTAPSASTVAPYHYSQMVWGALLGYFIFDEVPEKSTMMGAAVIIGAGLYLIWRETRRRPF
ncbi:MAG TPA: DMT family transporter, partial [Alphaproteobacteria bacterium]|nr:DMT family transporter [Alphaproteobacteria bacterium]